MTGSKLLLTSNYHVIDCNDIVLFGIAVIVSYAELHVFCGRVLSKKRKKEREYTFGTTFFLGTVGIGLIKLTS